MKTYRYLSQEKSVVAVFDSDGVSRMSMAASAVPEGAEIQPYIPPPPAEIALQTISTLETAALIASQRLYREAVLDMMRRRAEESGMTEAQLIAKNKGYRQLKAFDQQIDALRDQL